MPLYRDHLAQQFEEKRNEFGQDDEGKRAIDVFRDATNEVAQGWSKVDIESYLDSFDIEGALPTTEFDDTDDIVIPFEESQAWESHEGVNRWARSLLEGGTTVGVDGSQIDPVDEFEDPIALVQAVWLANSHQPGGEYDQGVETEILTPEDLYYEHPQSGLLQVDQEEVSTARYELELQLLGEQIEAVSGHDPPAVVMHDGPFVLSFTQAFRGPTRSRYGDALGKVLGASEYHRVPIVGYTAGSKASDFATMLERLDLIETDRTVRDYQIFEESVQYWGDRTPLFISRRDNSLEQLQGEYRGEQYDFTNRILFTYLNISDGPQLDRIDMPAWVLTEDLVGYVLRAVRAEAGVGRGYPEILQAADADAVISQSDRNEFLHLYQAFSEEYDMDLRWNNKALSKQRRRRT